MGKRKTILLFLLILAEAIASGQGPLQGKVTYITSQHVYVRFSSTEGLADGDTLYLQESRGEVPILVILNHSSTSCVCEPLVEREFRLSEQVIAWPEKLNPDEFAASSKTGAKTPGVGPDTVQSDAPVIISPEMSDKPVELANKQNGEVDPDGFVRKQEFYGRFAVSSYSYLKNRQSDGRERLRYAFSMAARNIGGSGLSVETYTTFSHTLKQWDEINENIFKGLKIYNLSASYSFNQSMRLVTGRRINPKLASVGAIDGLQFEMKFGSLSAGIIAGSRPDYKDYSINTGLFQYGAYLAHDFKGAAGSMQNTLAYIEQLNHGQTDRRFVYFQHSNTLVSKLWFYGSMEADLYQQVEGRKQMVFNLYNTYVNLRYRVFDPLTLSLSYSARNNLIYYETYKDFLDRLLDEKTLQGWRFRVNYRPIPHLYLGAHAAYRYRKDDPRPSKNAHGYITYSLIPGIGASVTATVTWMQSAYLDGMIYGVGIGRPLLRDKLYADLKYHFVDQSYRNAEMDIDQHVGEAGLRWAARRKLSLSVYYEGSFEGSMAYHRIFASLSQRF